MHLSLSWEKKRCSSSLFLIILYFFSNTPTLPLHPFSLVPVSISSVSNCIWIFFYWCNLVIARSFKSPQVHLHRALGRLVFLGSPGGNIRWPGTPLQNPGHQGGLLSQYLSDTPPPSHPFPAFKCSARSKLWGCTPQTSPRGSLEALYSPTLSSIYSFISSCSHIHFISSSFYCNQYRC